MLMDKYANNVQNVRVPHRHVFVDVLHIHLPNFYSFPGDGESVKDPSEEKPKSEAEGVEEPAVGEEGESVDSKEDAQKDAAEEHVEL